MRDGNLIFFQKINIFYNFLFQEASKIVPRLKYIIIPFKKVISRRFFSENQEIRPEGWKRMFLFFSKKDIIFIANKNIKFNKIKSIYFPENPEIKVFYKKKKFLKFTKILISNLNSTSFFKIGLLGHQNPNFFLSGHVGFSNYFQIRFATKNALNNSINFRSRENQKMIIAKVRFYHFIFVFLKIEIIPKILVFLISSQSIKKVTLLSKIRKSIRKTISKKNIIPEILIRNDKNSSLDKRIFGIGIYNKVNQNCRFIKLEKVFFVNPSRKKMIFYQLFIKMSEILINKIIFMKNLKSSQIAYMDTISVFAENISSEIYGIKSYYQFQENCYRKSADLSQLNNRNNYFYGTLDFNKGFYDILISSSFFFSPRGKLIETDNFGSKSLKKITFFSGQKMEHNPFPLAQKIKLNEISIILCFIREKKNNQTMNEETFFGKNFKIAILIKQMRSGLCSLSKKFLNFNDTDFFFVNKRISIFQYGSFFLIPFWAIKRVQIAKKRLNLFLKIEFFTLKSVLDESNSKLCFFHLGVCSIRTGDFTKVIFKLTIFRIKYSQKKSNLKKREHFVKLFFLKENIPYLANIFFKTIGEFEGKKAGIIQFHNNGITLIYIDLQETIEICFNNLRYIFYEKDVDQRFMIVHLHFWKSLKIKSKDNLKGVQIFCELCCDKSKSCNIDEPDKNIDEFIKETKKKIQSKISKEKFCFFLNSLLLISGKKLDIKNLSFGFCGTLNRAPAFVSPTKNCIIHLNTNFTIVIPFSEIEIVFFERITTGIKNFDGVFVLNWFRSTSEKRQTIWVRISSIDFTKIDLIENLLLKNLIKFTKGPFNLNWSSLVNEIGKSRHDFFKKKGWRFLEKDEQNDIDYEFIPDKHSVILKIKNKGINNSSDTFFNLNWKNLIGIIQN